VPSYIRFTFLLLRLVDPIARDRSIAGLGVDVGHDKWSSGQKTT
jgi:hypothetical protein